MSVGLACIFYDKILLIRQTYRDPFLTFNKIAEQNQRLC